MRLALEISIIIIVYLIGYKTGQRNYRNYVLEILEDVEKDPE